MSEPRAPHRFLQLRADRPGCILCDRDLLDPIHTGRYLGQDPDDGAYDMLERMAASRGDTLEESRGER